MAPTELIFTILASLGGGGALVLGLGAWLGKVWAARIKESDKARFSKELEELRNDLELTRAQQHRISEAQFSLYSEVWVHLQDVKFIGDQLWERATVKQLEAFRSALENARRAIYRSRLILIEAHYQDLLTTLAAFQQYEIGKGRLIEIRTPEEMDEVFRIFSEEAIREQIRANGAVRERYERALADVVKDFRKQLGLSNQ